MSRFAGRFASRSSRLKVRNTGAGIVRASPHNRETRPWCAKPITQPGSDTQHDPLETGRPSRVPAVKDTATKVGRARLLQPSAGVSALRVRRIRTYSQPVATPVGPASGSRAGFAFVSHPSSFVAAAASLVAQEEAVAETDGAGGSAQPDEPVAGVAVSQLDATLDEDAAGASEPHEVGAALDEAGARVDEGALSGRVRLNVRCCGLLRTRSSCSPTTRVSTTLVAC